MYEMGGERYPRCVTDFRWPERAQPRLMLSGERSRRRPRAAGREAGAKAGRHGRAGKSPAHVLATRTRVHRSGETAAVP